MTASGSAPPAGAAGRGILARGRGLPAPGRLDAAAAGRRAAGARARGRCRESSEAAREAATAAETGAVELLTVRGVTRSAARPGRSAAVAVADLRADAGAEAGHDDRRDGGELRAARGRVVGEHRQLARPAVARAAAAAAQQQREREQRGDLLDRAVAQRTAGDQRVVDAGGDRLAAARLAVRDVAREPPRVAGAEAAARRRSR